MSDVHEDLDRLNELLDGISVECDGMSIGELDGYVAALVVCPVEISPSEWLPAVWGSEAKSTEIDEAEEIVAAVIGRYNRIARELAEDPESYAPVMEVDSADGDLLWSPWINGFERAIRLRADAWEEIALGDDEEAAASVSMILAMNAFDLDESELTEEAQDELDSMAPEMIHAFVRNLKAWTKARPMQRNGLRQVDREFEDPPVYERRVGRNDPCPRGSGRKCKRCYGAN